MIYKIQTVFQHFILAVLHEINEDNVNRTNPRAKTRGILSCGFRN